MKRRVVGVPDTNSKKFFFFGEFCKKRRYYIIREHTPPRPRQIFPQRDL